MVLLIYFVSYNVKCCWCSDFPLLSPPAWSDQFWYSVFFFVFFKLLLLLLFCNTECSMIAGALTLYCYHLRWQAGTDQFWYSVFFVCFFKLLLLLLFCITKRSMIAVTLTLHCYHLRWQAGTWKPTNCATNCGRRLN